jgi:hypothetical protein
VHIRTSDFKLLAAQLENLIEYWMTYLAYEPGGPSKWQKAFPATPSERRAALKVVRTARKEVRRKMTDDHLQKAADTYRAVNSARTGAVARAFGVSYRTAQRYIEKARETGVLQ